MSVEIATGSAASPISDRVRQIIEATVAVMGRQGYAATSMKDIAQEAGIAQGLIHYYFSSKEDLLAAVVQSLCEEMLADMRRDLAETTAGDPLTRAWQLLDKVRLRCAARPEFSRLLLEMIVLSFGNETLTRHLRRLYADLTSATDEMVRDLDASLPTQLPVPTEDVAAVICATIDGLILRGLVDPERDQYALYRAFGFIMVSCGLLSYSIAGQPLPVEPLVQIVGQPLPHGFPPGPAAGGE